MDLYNFGSTIRSKNKIPESIWRVHEESLVNRALNYPHPNLHTEILFLFYEELQYCSVQHEPLKAWVKGVLKELFLFIKI